MKFRVGDIVKPNWGLNITNNSFEVIGYDGEFVRAIHLNDAHTYTGYTKSSVICFFESELSIDTELTRDNKISKLEL
jgi:hypothetical protein